MRTIKWTNLFKRDYKRECKGQEKTYKQMTLDALTDVDTGKVVEHKAVLAWANSLSTDNPLPLPTISPH